jgi:hypothetical protein
MCQMGLLAPSRCLDEMRQTNKDGSVVPYLQLSHAMAMGTHTRRSVTRAFGLERTVITTALRRLFASLGVGAAVDAGCLGPCDSVRLPRRPSLIQLEDSK